ncbi:hypothetical protein IFM61606_01459 [Aspergillus udagawae]|uniref:Secreted protein n=1 Tax=Aspergillus udagawae TaxID=91492 RepID=A0ABQ1A2N2_9EURO|nr:hypothetical protein IFM53868_00691 [Aspergillus udagawae]GFG21605.1 hypothetical protein IFM61606_01459 [Aspergillus udagawae]
MVRRSGRNDNGSIIATAAAAAAAMMTRAAAARVGTRTGTGAAAATTAAASAPKRTWNRDAKRPRAVFDDSHAGPGSVVNFEEAHIDYASWIMMTARRRGAPFT